MASILERQHEFADQVTVIRARGKAILVPLIKVMTHFKIDFGLVHDADSPYKRNGHKNGMWTENEKIRTSMQSARQAGLTVRHRVSIPNFERYLGGEEASKDKPLNAYLQVSQDDRLAGVVQELLTALMSSAQHEPYGDEAIRVSGYMPLLRSYVLDWAEQNGLGDDVRFKTQDNV